MKYFVPVLLILTFFSCSDSEQLKTGDLVFQNLDNSELSDAIENATASDDTFKISHMGIVSIEGDDVFVIEAYDSVQITPLVTFLERSKYESGEPKVIVGRLKDRFTNCIDQAIVRAKHLIGKPYDNNFKLNNGKYYCSELIYDTYLTQDESHLFSLKPMSFTNKKTGIIDSTWINYFKKHNSSVPEGELGNNPSDYAKSYMIDIISYKW